MYSTLIHNSVDEVQNSHSLITPCLTDVHNRVAKEFLGVAPPGSLSLMSSLCGTVLCRSFSDENTRCSIRAVRKSVSDLINHLLVQICEMQHCVIPFHIIHCDNTAAKPPEETSQLLEKHKDDLIILCEKLHVPFKQNKSTQLYLFYRARAVVEVDIINRIMVNVYLITDTLWKLSFVNPMGLKKFNLLELRDGLEPLITERVFKRYYKNTNNTSAISVHLSQMNGGAPFEMDSDGILKCTVLNDCKDTSNSWMIEMIMSSEVIREKSFWSGTSYSAWRLIDFSDKTLQDITELKLKGEICIRLNYSEKGWAFAEHLKRYTHTIHMNQKLDDVTHEIVKAIEKKEAQFSRDLTQFYKALRTRFESTCFGVVLIVDTRMIRHVKRLFPLTQTRFNWISPVGNVTESVAMYNLKKKDKMT